MKTYQTLADGSFHAGGVSIPDDMGNRRRREMQQEVDAGTAEILPRVPPGPGPVAEIPLTVNDLIALLVAKGVLGRADILAAQQAKRDAGEA